VPFSDSTALAEATLRYLAKPAFQAATRRKAYEYARPMFWPNVGRQYLDVFNQVARADEKRMASVSAAAFPGASGKRLAVAPMQGGS
jgi:hypothetical protein